MLLCNYYTFFRVKGLYVFSTSSRSKENIEDFEKYLMNVSHKFFDFFAPLFSQTKGNESLRGLKICVQPLYIHSYETKQISDILLIS